MAQDQPDPPPPTPIPGADLSARLAEEFGNALRIERELGGGGMSRVFLATDPALDRRVVIKVVSAGGGALSLERFRREMMLAAALHHPHIVPVLATGVVMGLPWYSMPYIEGRSLRDRLNEEGPLPIRDMLRILRDAARACAYAHEHGVVHRDLKPENILLAGDGAMIIDFGIAKALSEGQLTGGAAGAGLTRAGFTLGTPTYMAPEQAAADPSIGPAADLYSLGVVAFELAAGRPPFRGVTSHEVLRAHLAEPAPALETLRQDTPPEFARLVAECLAKSPAGRPASAAAVVEWLEGLLAGTTSGTRRAIVQRRPLLQAAAALLVVVLGFFGARRVVSAPVHQVPTASVAVLPFVPRGEDSASRVMATGLSDDLAAQLESIEGLHVAARLMVERLWRAPLAPKALADTLGVRALLDGVVRRDGGELKVIAQLVDAGTGAVIWTGTYRTVPDSLGEIVRSIQEHVRDALVSAKVAGGDARGSDGTGGGGAGSAGSEPPGGI
jgi:serine/threonine-protein kinase